MFDYNKQTKIPDIFALVNLRVPPAFKITSESMFSQGYIEQILKLSREEMNSVWGGIGGEKMWYWLRGEDFHDPELEHAKSITHSHMLPPAFRTIDGAYAVVSKLHPEDLGGEAFPLV